ncbi:MAG: hypothetical protein LM580_02155 [Thermofilum sp.]|nr:hypothetical protein [Thermofilum sp.]
MVEEVAYWWRGRLYSEREAPPLAVPLRLVKVESVEWLCPKCGERAEWGPEPRCPLCGAKCEPRTVASKVPELVDAVEALERAFSRVCEARFRGAVALEPFGLFLPLFTWRPLDLELPDGSRLVGVYAGKPRFLKRGFRNGSTFELPGNLAAVVWSGFLECLAFEVGEPLKLVELLSASAGFI